MKIVNAELVRAFSTAGLCEWCRRRTPTEAHHLFCKGMGGGSKLDVRLFLMSLCRECHQNRHHGGVTQECLLAIVAQREKVLQDDILAVLFFLRRTPQGATGTQVKAHLGELKPQARKMAEAILGEAKESVPAAWNWFTAMTWTAERN